MTAAPNPPLATATLRNFGLAVLAILVGIALLYWLDHLGVQKSRGLYVINDKTINAAVAARIGLPRTVITKVQTLQNETFDNDTEFRSTLTEYLDLPKGEPQMAAVIKALDDPISRRGKRTRIQISEQTVLRLRAATVPITDMSAQILRDKCGTTHFKTSECSFYGRVNVGNAVREWLYSRRDIEAIDEIAAAVESAVGPQPMQHSDLSSLLLMEGTNAHALYLTAMVGLLLMVIGGTLYVLLSVFGLLKPGASSAILDWARALKDHVGLIMPVVAAAAVGTTLGAAAIAGPSNPATRDVIPPPIVQLPPGEITKALSDLQGQVDVIEQRRQALVAYQERLALQLDANHVATLKTLSDKLDSLEQNIVTTQTNIGVAAQRDRQFALQNLTTEQQTHRDELTMLLDRIPKAIDLKLPPEISLSVKVTNFSELDPIPMAIADVSDALKVATGQIQTVGLSLTESNAKLTTGSRALLAGVASRNIFTRTGNLITGRPTYEVRENDLDQRIKSLPQQEQEQIKQALRPLLNLPFPTKSSLELEINRITDRPVAIRRQWILELIDRVPR